MSAVYLLSLTKADSLSICDFTLMMPFSWFTASQPAGSRRIRYLQTLVLDLVAANMTCCQHLTQGWSTYETFCLRAVSGSEATYWTMSWSTPKSSGLDTSFSRGSKIGASFTSCTFTTTVAVAVGSGVAKGTSFSTATNRVCLLLFSKSRPWCTRTAAKQRLKTLQTPTSTE